MSSLVRLFKWCVFGVSLSLVVAPDARSFQDIALDHFRNTQCSGNGPGGTPLYMTHFINWGGYVPPNPTIRGQGGAQCFYRDSNGFELGGPFIGYEITLDLPPAIPATNSPYQPAQVCSSVISVDSQVLGERISVTGTPYTLVYQSDRVPGIASQYTLEIPVTGSVGRARFFLSERLR